jgi:hypothetical protein
MKASGWLLGGLFVSVAASAADFSGAWQIASSMNGNAVNIVCTLLQEGDQLRGSCKPDGFDASTLSGSVTGERAKWSYDVVFNGKPAHVEYEAELGADGRLTGALYRSGSPTPFTATKR